MVALDADVISFFRNTTMSSSLEKLVPILDGTNYREWSVMMQAYLQTQELWDYVNGTAEMPVEPQPTTARDGTTTAVPAADMRTYQRAQAAYVVQSDKALGAITLRLAPQLRHYRGTYAFTTWRNSSGHLALCPCLQSTQILS